MDRNNGKRGAAMEFALLFLAAVVGLGLLITTIALAANRGFAQTRNELRARVELSQTADLFALCCAQGAPFEEPHDGLIYTVRVQGGRHELIVRDDGGAQLLYLLCDDSGQILCRKTGKFVNN